MTDNWFGWIFLGVMIGLAMLGLFGCSPEKVYISDYCLKARPITFDSMRDTQETVEQVEAHNADWCGSCHPTKCKDE